jgi:hypothetical protein
MFKFINKNCSGKCIKKDIETLKSEKEVTIDKWRDINQETPKIGDRIMIIGLGWTCPKIALYQGYDPDWQIRPFFINGTSALPNDDKVPHWILLPKRPS